MPLKYALLYIRDGNLHFYGIAKNLGSCAVVSAHVANVPHL